MSGSEDEEDGAGLVSHEEDEKAPEFEPHPIALSLSSVLKTTALSTPCGDFATFGIAALPLPGLSILLPAPALSSASRSRAFQIGLPLTHAQAVDELKARCSAAADGSGVWELSSALKIRPFERLYVLSLRVLSVFDSSCNKCRFRLW
jgi:hypothetical protein